MEYTPLSERDTEVLRHAVEASNRLYVKGIQEVGAAVCTTTGQIFAGIHFETSRSIALEIAQTEHRYGVIDATIKSKFIVRFQVKCLA